MRHTQSLKHGHGTAKQACTPKLTVKYLITGGSDSDCKPPEGSEGLLSCHPPSGGTVQLTAWAQPFLPAGDRIVWNVHPGGFSDCDGDRYANPCTISIKDPGRSAVTFNAFVVDQYNQTQADDYYVLTVYWP